MTAFNVSILDWSGAREDACGIRKAVFVVEQGVPLEIELDEFDAVSEHALARSTTGEAIGTGRLLPDGHIGRMAVRRDWRGSGVGRAILRALIARAETRSMRSVVLHAQTHAEAFYAREGFVTEGPVFLEAGIPHVVMRRACAAGP